MSAEIVVVIREKGKPDRDWRASSSDSGYILIDVGRGLFHMNYWPPDKKWPPDGLKETLQSMLDVYKEE